MHRSAVRIAVLASLVLGSETSLVGCQITPYEIDTTHGRNVEHAARGIERGVGLIDATLTSVQELVEKPTADPAAQFRVFAMNLDLLDAVAQDVRSLSEAMEANREGHFAEWDRQIAAIADENDRSRSHEQREEVFDSLEEIRAEYGRAREEFGPLLGSLEEIRSALAADLSPQGIDAVKDKVGELAGRAEAVEATLTVLSERFRELGVDIRRMPPRP